MFSLFNTHRRIGDYLAGTKLKVTEKRPLKSIISDVKTFKIRGHSVLTLAASILFTAFVIYCVDHGSLPRLSSIKKHSYVFRCDDGETETGKYRHPDFPTIVKEKSGHFVAYHNNGKQWFESYYTNGVPHGAITMFSSDGVKEFETNYLNGKNHGKMIWWHPNGMKMKECNWVHGQKNGDWIEWDNAGNEIHRISYLDDVRQDL